MIWLWIGFITFVLLMLALDLGVFHRKAHVIRLKEALAWSTLWVTLGLAFSAFVYVAYDRHWFGIGLPPEGDTTTVVDLMAVTPDNPQGINHGTQATVKYLTGYVIEKSLSVDNIFVIAMIFSFLAVPPIYQHRVLFWGIIGALVMRGVMIAIGAQLIREFSWIIYVFGAFLILTGIKMLFITSHSDPTQNVVVRLAKRLFPVTDRFHGQHFFVRAGSTASHESPVPGAQIEQDPAVDRMERLKPGTLMMTPLFLALLLVEFTDLIFAVDSIPAIFAITTDPFLVFTSNVFAILGLRSLYFALAGMIDKFRYLKVSLAAVLVLVGVKMMTHTQLKALLGEHFNLYLLAVVLLILAGGVVASLVADRRRGVANPLDPNSQNEFQATAGDTIEAKPSTERKTDHEVSTL
ncbi:MAG TPA: TerC family protein [Tepidisphaeraceae bacterium]|nr:TerC family protein [Tepidisphaeraceae bacterium]